VDRRGEGDFSWFVARYILCQVVGNDGEEINMPAAVTARVYDTKSPKLLQWTRKREKKMGLPLTERELSSYFWHLTPYSAIVDENGSWSFLANYNGEEIANLEKELKKWLMKLVKKLY